MMNSVTMGSVKQRTSFYENLINFTKPKPARTNPENNFQLRRAGLCVSAGQGKIAIKQTEFTKEREEETCLNIYFSRLPSMV